jgi:hypothetical protein
MVQSHRVATHLDSHHLVQVIGPLPRRGPIFFYGSPIFFYVLGSEYRYTWRCRSCNHSEVFKFRLNRFGPPLGIGYCSVGQYLDIQSPITPSDEERSDSEF